VTLGEREVSDGAVAAPTGREGVGLEYVKVERDGKVVVLTIDREEKLNALNARVQEEVAEALLSLRGEDHRALVLTGAGERAFVAGADLGEMKGMSVLEVKRFGELGKRMMEALEGTPVPTIAAVNGYALGGGAELALTCDIRIAAENASFGFPEVTVGIMPGAGGTQRLPRVVGTALARELIFTGRRVSAQEAKEIGLVNRVVPQGEALAAAKEMAREIAANAPVAVRHAKAALDAALSADPATGIEYEADQFALLFATEDALEGMTAFAERRKPRFRGL
jgi:enoyl-CoA hydratase